MNTFNINTITIKNFHCYQNIMFTFAQKANVFIGKNGSGKSSMVKAIKNGLSIFFSNNTSWGKGSLVGSVSDLSTANLSPREIWHDEKMKPAENVDIRIEANFNGEVLPAWSFSKSSKDKSKLLTSLYQAAFVAFMDEYAKCDTLPLFAYYSDSFPHVGTDLGKTIKEMIDKDDYLDRSWGYYHWDYDTSCAEIWQKRFIRIFKLHANYVQMLNDEEDKESKYAKELETSIRRYADELNYVKNYLVEFSNGDFGTDQDGLQIKNLIVDGIDNPYIVAVFENGKRRCWDELPAGYERMFNMVFDIACRSYILNRGKQVACGLVIIDELDLHLHPSMEKTILQRLKQTFPDIQFIVTTHSPLVITNFEQDADNKLFRLSFGEDKTYGKEEIPNLYGLDYNSGLTEVMETSDGDQELIQIKKAYEYWKSKDRSKADKIAEMIKARYSKNVKFIESLNL